MVCSAQRPAVDRAHTDRKQSTRALGGTSCRHRYPPRRMLGSTDSRRLPLTSREDLTARAPFTPVRTPGKTRCADVIQPGSSQNFDLLRGQQCKKEEERVETDKNPWSWAAASKPGHQSTCRRSNDSAKRSRPIGRNSSQTKKPFKTAAPRPQVTHGQNIFRYVRKLTLSATHVYRNGAWRDSVTPDRSLVTVVATNKGLSTCSLVSSLIVVGAARALSRLFHIAEHSYRDDLLHWAGEAIRAPEDTACLNTPNHRKPTHPGNYVITITGLLEQSQPGKQKGPPASI
ncbi:hypothetical protein Bbelb_141410 [Branchiostoma belcheri]|nr:hypothetical protein Bbelb_141410 [Branchiostoma belcheri]